MDPRLIEEVVGLASRLGCGSQDIVEVGSGLGFLTIPLSRVCRRVISIEVDPRLYRVAAGLIARGSPNVELILGDAIEVLESLEGYQGVVGSIPYSITGALLSTIARGRARWAVLVLQKDVVERITSPPGTRAYGSIGVLVNLAFRVAQGSIYPPSSFYPEPEVYSQTIIMERRGEGIEIDPEFESFLKCMFSQRKRLAYKAVKKCLGIDIEKTSTRVFQMRPEEIYEVYLRSLRGRDSRALKA